MAKIDDFTAAKAFGIGVLLSAVNPKNLGLTLAAAATIGGSSMSTSEEYVVILLFVVVASSTVATPVILNLILGSRAAATLTTMKEWLVANNATVMSVLFVVLGANVFGTGFSILAWRILPPMQAISRQSQVIASTATDRIGVSHRTRELMAELFPCEFTRTTGTWCRRGDLKSGIWTSRRVPSRCI